MFRAIQTNDESTGKQKVIECRQFLIENLRSVSSDYSKVLNPIESQSHAAATELIVRQNI